VVITFGARRTAYLLRNRGLDELQQPLARYHAVSTRLRIQLNKYSTHTTVHDGNIHYFQSLSKTHPRGTVCTTKGMYQNWTTQLRVYTTPVTLPRTSTILTLMYHNDGLNRHPTDLPTNTKSRSDPFGFNRWFLSVAPCLSSVARVK
jgi:hypothetical protein